MKKSQSTQNYDLSDYEEITGNALFKINGGGEQVENSHEAVAKAKPGDFIVNSKGEISVLVQGDINFSQNQIGNGGNPGNGNTGSQNNSNQSTEDSHRTGPDSSSSSSEKKSSIKEPTTYAAYKQKQDEAKRDRKDRKVYVDYNVLSDHRSKAYNIELKVRNLPDRKKSVEGNTIKGKDLGAKLFKQTEFNSKKGFTDGFEQTACNATSLLNIISQQYTKETGQQLSTEDACYILKAATTEKRTIYHKNKEGGWDPVIETAINPVNALVNDGATALNVMLEALENKYSDDSIFDGYFGYKKGSPSDILDGSYSVLKVKGNTFANHYINDFDDPKTTNVIEYWDTYWGYKDQSNYEILGTNVYNYYK